MQLLENLRKSTFWSLDFIKGSPVRRHYDEIKFLIENPNSQKTIETKENSLIALLNHASSTTEFYNNYSSSKNLNDFPIINKTIILNNFDSFQSEQFRHKKNKLATTSGSTGIPFKLWLNQNKKYRNTADTIYFSELANYNLGRLLIYIKVWVKKNHKNRLTLFTQNILKHDVMRASSDDLKLFIKQLNKNSTSKTIIGYSSFFEQLCLYLDSTKTDISNANVQSIIAIAEFLHEDTKKSLEKYFETGVFSRYSNQENGILAQQTANTPNSYLINTASYHMEVLHPDRDELVPLGTWGRIVITDIFNYAMPIIRYDTGDLGVLEESDNGLLYLKEVLGRKFDMIYDTSGNLITPHKFYFITNYSKCRQFQFVQESKTKYKFILNATQEQTDEEAASIIFKKMLGKGADLSFEYVDQIPQLSSGKRQKVVSNYHKK